MAKKVVLVGANHAGTAAAKQILGAKKDIELTIFDSNSNISFLGCGMAIWIGGQISTGDGLFYSDKEELESLGATVNMETEVIQIDYDNKIVHYRDASGRTDEISYDDLILATGSSPIRPNIPGIDLRYIQKAKLYQDAELAVGQIKNDPSIKKVGVVGAGYIGAELAEAYRRVGKEVVLVDVADRILSTHFDRDFTDVMEERLKENGIKLALGERVTAFEGSERVERIVTDKNSYNVDLVMLCIGFRPNSQLGGDRLNLFKNGAFLVNKKQETSEKGVYAIGDCATVYDNSIRDTNYIALATNAVRSGIVAGLNVAGADIESIGVQGSSALSLYGLKMVSTGLTLEGAESNGIKAKMTNFEDWQKPEFMNEAGPNDKVKIRIVYREDNREIIGAQLISDYDMSGIINMFSLAIQERVTIERIGLLDIFFMPHFNKPYNYITMAALSAK